MACAAISPYADNFVLRKQRDSFETKAKLGGEFGRDTNISQIELSHAVFGTFLPKSLFRERQRKGRRCPYSRVVDDSGCCVHTAGHSPGKELALRVRWRRLSDSRRYQRELRVDCNQ